MKKFIFNNKVKILSILFFTLLLLSLNNNVFATTVDTNQWSGAPSYATIPSLELKTLTDSYITLINNDRNEVVILEPYNPNDYIALYTSSSSENGTMNRLSGYSTSSESLTDIIVYKSTFSTSSASWSDWSSTVSSSVSAYAPVNTNYIYKFKSNVVLYTEYFGIIGNDVISSGIPLPEGIEFTDNIALVHRGSRTPFFLCYSDDSNNTFYINGSYIRCKSPTGSDTTFTFWTYDTNSNTFINRCDGVSLSDAIATSYRIIGYSTNNFILDDVSYAYSTNDFFQLAPLVEETPQATTLLEIMEQVEKKVVLKEIVALLPVILSVLVSLLALRKALKMLLAFLRVS